MPHLGPINEQRSTEALESMMCSLHNIETSLDSIEASLSRLADAVCSIKECQSSVEMGNALKALAHLETPTEITVRKEE